MKKIIYKIIALTLITALLGTTLPAFPVFAWISDDEALKTTLNFSNGSIVISPTGATENGVSKGLNPKGYIITGGSATATANSINVTGAGNYDITINNLIIVKTGDTNINAEPFSVVNGANVTLRLKGANSFEVGYHSSDSSKRSFAALHVAAGASLTIDTVDGTDTPSLTSKVSGSSSNYSTGAAIGSSGNENSGDITINHGTVTANGGKYSAAI